MNRLRKELYKAMDGLPVTRTPSLRRSDSEGYLFSSDLPRLLPAETLTAFIQVLKNVGWSVSVTENNIMELDRKLPPPEIRGNVSFTPEAACCVWLLKKHPGKADGRDWERRLAKARDAGKPEACCRQLHRELSVLLRYGKELPDIDVAFFTDTRE